MKAHRLLAPILLAAVLAGCKNMTAADVAGRVIAGAVTAAPALFLTDADEIKLGQQTMAQVFAEMPEFPDPELRDYVNAVGQKMVAQQERQGLAYQFHVVQSKDVNAFAAPGGFVFVTVPALRLMQNEAQLAGVLGHEVGHVAKKHSINAIKQQMVAQGLLTGALQGSNNQLIEAGAKIGAGLILKGFDRGAEEEADRMGALYSYGAGYNPLELGGFLNRLRQTSGDVPAWLSYFSDHPRTDDRLVKINDFVMAQHMATDGTSLGEASFQANVLNKLGATPLPSPSPASTP